jgi:hypothetical protein
LADKAEEQKDGVADRIGAIADRAHSTADELRDREAWLAGLIDRGARELDEFADAVRHRDIASLWNSLESFARRQPALFMGAAVAAGFALTRVARASMERQYHDAYATGLSHGRGDSGLRSGQALGGSYGTAQGGHVGSSPTSGTGARYGTGSTGAGYGTGGTGQGSTGAGYGMGSTGQGGSGSYGTSTGSSPTSGTGADYGMAGKSQGSTSSGSYGTGSSPTSGTGADYGALAAGAGSTGEANKTQRTSTEFERHVQGAAAAPGGGTTPGGGSTGSAY